MKNTKRSSSVYYSILLLIVLAGVVMVNILVWATDFRIDLTEDQRYSLTESTKEVLDSDSLLKERILFKVYLEGDKLPAELRRLRNSIKDKLDEFKYYAGKKVEYEFIDPTEGTEADFKELSEQLMDKGNGLVPLVVNFRSNGTADKLVVFPGAKVEYKGITSGYVQFLQGGNADLNAMLDQKIQNSITNIEYELMKAIDKAARTSKKSIGILHGHGELPAPKTAYFRRQLEDAYDFKDLAINGQINALDEVDGLIIADPNRKFSDKDKFVIDQFLMRGGKLMVFSNPLNINNDSLRRNQTVYTRRKRTGLEDLIYDYGIKMNEDLVVDANYGYFFLSKRQETRPLPWYFYIRSQGTDHPISSQVDPVFLMYASSLQFVKQDGLKPHILLTSSNNSKVHGQGSMLVSLGMTRLGELPDFADVNNDMNKKMLGAIVEGKFNSAFKNRIISTYTDNPDARFLAESKAPGKLMVVSSGTFFANQYYDSVYVPETNSYKYYEKRSGPYQIEDLIDNPFPKGNFEFMQNAVDYMMGEEALLSVRSRSIDLHPTDKKKVVEQAGFYKAINLAIPLGSILLLGIITLFIRKRKYAK
ncbi:gliding motility-associated ABC transporter substrate-binding protein GldG [Lishizhenia sp.]|uniref:gliding motility-associated ABC transporter substrate-binding protein GldG n=1 Tax=Lishizhenia sp. TaxID=2497594 RepID=UPI00299DF5E8|nr:gliding motility-associated ABC transporter substrate-binding protein GldG [Lishizhenia sp.]MDX1445204.1 gliding motility-associated ABC transporter substrate-binding protein GldG [Lishizhenia sp.]